MGAALNNIHDLGFSAAEVQPEAETHFLLLDGHDATKEEAREGWRVKDVEFTDEQDERWGDQEPTLNSEAVRDLNNASEGMKKVVMRLHDAMCVGKITDRDLWKLQQNTLAVIGGLRERLSRESATESPNLEHRVDVFTRDLEARLLELNLTDPALKTIAPRGRPAAFHLLPLSDSSEIERANAKAFLEIAERIWDALKDAQDTKMLHVALSITSCRSHSKVDYYTRGFPSNTAWTDAIINPTKARIHFDVTDPASNKKIEFDRDFFAQPERRVAIWCTDDPYAEVWYVK